eukprot:1126093-Prorocentrum_minimum.AAC.5
MNSKKSSKRAQDYTKYSAGLLFARRAVRVTDTRPSGVPNKATFRKTRPTTREHARPPWQLHVRTPPSQPQNAHG